MSADYENTNKRLLIINVDTGIDDAQAIMMALADPDVKILAICLSHGNSTIKNTAINTLKLLTAIQRTDIPVYRGCGHALVIQPPRGDGYYGKDSFGDYDGLPTPDLDFIQPEHAVSAMVRLAKNYPDEITLVNLAPFTNLAIAHRMDPEFSNHLKDCFLMGGNYQGKGNIMPSAEFNFYFDVEAAKIVLTEFVCKMYIITWELCMDSALPWKVYDKLREMPSAKAKLMKALESKLIDGWKSMGPYTISDELAMTTVLRQQSITDSKYVSADVECNGSLTRGQMVVDWRNKWGKKPNVHIVTKMNTEFVIELLTLVYKE